MCRADDITVLRWLPEMSMFAVDVGLSDGTRNACRLSAPDDHAAAFHRSAHTTRQSTGGTKGKRRQIAEMSAREVQREMSGLDAVIEEIAEIRRKL